MQAIPKIGVLESKQSASSNVPKASVEQTDLEIA